MLDRILEFPGAQCLHRYFGKRTSRSDGEGFVLQVPGHVYRSLASFAARFGLQNGRTRTRPVF
jgi:hypothetical protein